MGKEEELRDIFRGTLRFASPSLPRKTFTPPPVGLKGVKFDRLTTMLQVSRILETHGSVQKDWIPQLRAAKEQTA